MERKSTLRRTNSSDLWNRNYEWIDIVNADFSSLNVVFVEMISELQGDHSFCI